MIIDSQVDFCSTTKLFCKFTMSQKQAIHSVSGLRSGFFPQITIRAHLLNRGKDLEY
jgi:hypothetical protein